MRRDIWFSVILCVCICISVHMYIRMYVYIYIYTYMYVYLYMYIFIHQTIIDDHILQILPARSLSSCHFFRVNLPLRIAKPESLILPPHFPGCIPTFFLVESQISKAESAYLKIKSIFACWLPIIPHQHLCQMTCQLESII